MDIITYWVATYPQVKGCFIWYDFSMKILSLFDGMSVAQQALKDAGIPVDNYYASEIDEYAIAVTQSNFPNTVQLGSVTEVKKEMVGDIDLLVGGSPCTDLSIAKKGRQGLQGEQSKLFYEFVRLVKEVKPKFFILENVASMAKDQKAIMEHELFDIPSVMVNASLVSAQNRKRIFIVGKWNGEKYEQVEIPQPEDRGILLKDILEENVDEKYYVKNVDLVGTQSNIKKELDFIGGIRNKDWARDGKSYSRNFGQGDRVYSDNGKSATLSALGGGRGAKTGLYAVKSNYNNTLNYNKANTLGSNSQCQTAKTGQGLVNMETHQIRKLTPIETLRLQSMPDDFFDKATYKGKPISNTQRYKMCGNAFNKEVIVHILKHLK